MTSRNVEWTENAWDEYIYWQTQDKKILKRINTLGCVDTFSLKK